jgi:hypothetical protein
MNAIVDAIFERSKLAERLEADFVEERRVYTGGLPSGAPASRPRREALQFGCELPCFVSNARNRVALVLHFLAGLHTRGSSQNVSGAALRGRGVERAHRIRNRLNGAVADANFVGDFQNAFASP